MLDMPVPYAETPGATPGVTPSAHLLGYPAAPPVAHLPPFPYPPTHAVAHVRQVSDGEIVLSDGELPPQDAGDDLSDGEIVEVGAWPHARPAAPPGPAYPASDGSDVIGIVKERVGDILGLKDPKLLQSARLRALMLLLKCIKLDDPDAIYAHIKDTQLAVASELNVLAHEFRLDMIADACMNAVLTTRTVTTGPAVSAAPADVDMLSASSADRPSDTMTPGALPSPTPADDTAATYTDPATAADPTTEADESSEASAPETDMDTSSDRSYIADTPELAPVADLARHDSPCVSRLRMPSAEPHFSRSQAPSPPNAHSLGVRPALRACDSPASGAVSGIGTPRHLAAVFGSSSAVCSSERGRLVVFVDESSSDSGSESGSDSDDGTGTLATPVGESSDGQLLQAKMDLREKEAAIARLKLQISQKQTRALLRKRLQQSLLQRAGTLSGTPVSAANGAASVPSTPPVAESSDGDVHSAQSAPPTVATESSDSATPPAVTAEPTEESRPERAASDSSPDPSCPAETKLGVQLQSLTLAMDDSYLAALGVVAEGARSAHTAVAMWQLDQALQAKRDALRLAARGSTGEPPIQLGHLVIQIAKRQRRQTNKRAAAQERLRLLQAEMALAQAELVAAEYAIQADHECSSMIDAGRPAAERQGSAAAQAEALARD
ncbi:hypothetical protein IWQ57_002628, partial [Coemansia nantahalensis]